MSDNSKKQSNQNKSETEIKETEQSGKLSAEVRESIREFVVDLEDGKLLNHRMRGAINKYIWSLLGIPTVLITVSGIGLNWYFENNRNDLMEKTKLTVETEMNSLKTRQASALTKADELVTEMQEVLRKVENSAMEANKTVDEIKNLSDDVQVLQQGLVQVQKDFDSLKIKVDDLKNEYDIGVDNIEKEYRYVWWTGRDYLQRLNNMTLQQQEKLEGLNLRSGSSEELSLHANDVAASLIANPDFVDFIQRGGMIIDEQLAPSIEPVRLDEELNLSEIEALDPNTNISKVPAFSKTRQGWVNIRGLVDLASNGGDKVLFKLPSDYQPKYSQIFIAAAFDGNTRKFTLAILGIGNTGDVTVLSAPTAPGSYLSLSGISFWSKDAGVQSVAGE